MIEKTLDNYYSKKLKNELFKYLLTTYDLDILAKWEKDYCLIFAKKKNDKDYTLIFNFSKYRAFRYFFDFNNTIEYLDNNIKALGDKEDERRRN